MTTHRAAFILTLSVALKQHQWHSCAFWEAHPPSYCTLRGSKPLRNLKFNCSLKVRTSPGCAEEPTHSPGYGPAPGILDFCTAGGASSPTPMALPLLWHIFSLTQSDFFLQLHTPHLLLLQRTQNLPCVSDMTFPFVS